MITHWTTRLSAHITLISLEYDVPRPIEVISKWPILKADAIRQNEMVSNDIMYQGVSRGRTVEK